MHRLSSESYVTIESGAGTHWHMLESTLYESHTNKYPHISFESYITIKSGTGTHWHILDKYESYTHKYSHITRGSLQSNLVLGITDTS